MKPRLNTLEALESRRLLAAAVLPAYVDKIGIEKLIDPTPTFSDDFNGSSLDASKWQIREGPRWRPSVNAPDSAFAWTHPSAVKVSNGELKLVAHKDPATGQLRSGWIQTSSRFEGTPRPGQPTPKLVSGRSANFTQKFGYWEAKLKFETVSGMWAAFWVHSGKMVEVMDDPKKDNRPDIYGTEMDVAEAGAKKKDVVSTVVHASGYRKFHRVGVTHTNVKSLTGSSPSAYHIYGLMWREKSIEFYLDGKLVHKETDPEMISKVAQEAILSTEIGAPNSIEKGEGSTTSWGSVPSNGYGNVSTSNAKLTADWVRVWKLAGSSSNPAPTPTPTTPKPSPTPAPTPTPVKASITGIVFNDQNINGQRNTSEPGLAGKTVYIDTNKNGKLDTSEKRTTTNAVGTYMFDGLSSGTYIVRQVLTSDTRQSSPTTTASQTVTLATNGKATINFATWTMPVATPASVGTSSITGSVYVDKNNNGIRDGADSPIANAVVFVDANKNGERDANERFYKTGKNGGYRFDKLAAGQTMFRLDLTGTGYTQTFPLDNAARSLNVGAGKSYAYMNFRARKA